MGRVARTGSSNSGKAGTTKIGKTRTKRRKRKDLEELHRNVLKAKRNSQLRISQKKKKKTTLEKVLNNFADKRQETESICQNAVKNKDKKKKSKTICNRLLPETIFGIYRNGIKGHGVNRENRKLDKINEARLRGDVLKLLNGDETNPKHNDDRFSWKENDKLADNNEESKALSSDESNYSGSIGGQTKTPILGKTKRVKRINGEKIRNNSIEDEKITAKKNEKQQFLQRENNCKRRLFEPNEEQTDSYRLGNAANSSDFVMGEIRFSPSPGYSRDVSSSEDCFGKKKKNVETKEKAKAKKIIDKKLMPNENRIGSDIWGWSPTIYYERLCAMVSAENFENNQSQRPGGSDPLSKIQSTLREFYRSACRENRRREKTFIAKGNKREEQTLSKVGVPFKDSSLPSSGEIQACITDSEMDQESSASGVSKVGSWRPKHFSKPKYSRISINTPDIFETTIHSKENASSENMSTSENEPNNNAVDKTSNTIEKTINSVASFLDKLRKNNPLNGTSNIFQDKTAECLSEERENFADVSTTKNQRDSTFSVTNQRKFARRNTKHVPTILRRSNSRSGVLENVEGKEKPLEPNNWLVNGRKRFTKNFAALPNISQSKIHESDYLQTPSVVNQLSAINKTKADIMKSKLNFMRAKYRNEAKSSSLDYRDFANTQKKHGKKMTKDRRQYAREFFRNGEKSANNRQLFPLDFAVFSQDKPIDRREDDGINRKANFHELDDFTDPNIRQIDFSQEKRNFPSSVSHKNSRYHMQTKLNFEFPCSEVDMNFHEGETQIFDDEMTNFSSHKINRDNSSESFTRPRYLSENPINESRLNDSVDASKCANEIQFVPESYIQHIPVITETNDIEIKNGSLNKPLTSYHANTLSVDRLAVNETSAGCVKRSRGVAINQRIRKPVMVFRPIQETRQQQEICDSRYRLTENGQGTINDYVGNFRNRYFNDNNTNSLVLQNNHQETYDFRYNNSQQQQQQQNKKHSHCHRQMIESINNEDYEKQPTKYLAIDESNGRNPRRLPIFVKSRDDKADNETALSYNNKVESTNLFSNFSASRNTEKMQFDDRTINDAVRNFRVLRFDDYNTDQSALNHQSQNIYHYSYESQEKEENKSFFQSHCNRRLIRNINNENFVKQPGKYSAIDEHEQRNSRRLPIHLESRDNGAPNESAVFRDNNIETTNLYSDFETPKNTEIMCFNCHDDENTRIHGARVKQQEQRPEMASRRTSEITVMLPCSSAFCQQATTTNNPETATSPRKPTSLKDVPRVVYSIKSCKTLVPVEIPYKLETSLYSAQPLYDNEKSSKRVQLPDGRVGILVTENGTVDNSECLDSNAGARSRFERIHMEKLNERKRSGLANDRIYY